MAGGGFGTREIHVAALVDVEGLMKSRNSRWFMGGELKMAEFVVIPTYAARVRTFVKLTEVNI